MEEALEMARSKDTKERMAGVERLYQLLEASRKSLSSSEVTSLVDCCLDLLKDNNFRVSQGALQALASAAVLSGEHLKLHFNALVPATVERLGDAKQPVRDSARRLLLTVMEVSSPTIIVERAGSYAWTHKSWRVREEFARTVTSAIGLFASTELPLQRAILPPEMYTQVGPQFRDELQRHHLPTSLVKDITTRLERIEPKVHSSDGLPNNYTAVEVKPTNLNPKKSSPKAKNSTREVSLFGGDNDVTEKPIDPIKVYSEKELIREFEKISSTLVPDKDWSIRIVAMQRVEGLVIGGATDYPSFRGFLKQLVGPLCTQLSDRRSTIVKQVLFKLVVITVLVIAESADNCIKTMLRNCKVARVLPRIADCAKNDRNAVLRARCCEYALLILEYWADAPEIQRAADLYEDFIRCCVADAMSEVRATARTCYRMFARTWPDRSRRLFLSFDPVIQRVINDEDGGMHRRHASPSLRERSSQMSFTPQAPAPSNIPGYGTSAIVAMDRSSSLSSGTSLSSGLLLSQAKPVGKGTERSLESVLHSSKQKVTAIESMLRGLDASEKHNPSTLRSSSLDLVQGVDPPSSRDPPFPLAVPASNNLATSLGLDTTTSGIFKGNNRNGGLALSDIITQIQASKDASKLSYRSSPGAEPLSALSSYSAKRASEKLQERGSSEANADGWEARRFMNLHVDRQYLDTPYKDANVRDSQNNYIPNFQRPLLRKNVTGRLSASRRSFDDSQISLGEMSSYVEGPASLNDALSEGLSPSSDWNARVAAFNYLHSLLQQGPKGIQEVTQNFEKVMKIFFQHLDDPHHKVAQAALSTLADIIPASLLRSLDEQRSPKAKLAVIEFAISSFNKHAMNSEGSVLNFIVSLSVEEQNSLRRALKQYTPRIEVDLMNFLQNKKDRQRPKSSYDPSDVVGTSSEEGYIGVSRKNHLFGRYSGGSMDSDGARKWSSTQETTQVTGSIGQDAYDENETQEHLYQGLGTDADCEVLITRPKDLKYMASSIDGSVNMDASSTPRLDVNGLMNYDHQRGLSIPQLLHLICNGNDENPTASKSSALQQLINASIANDQSIWTKYFNQILTVVLEVLDDSESSIRELAISLIAEMLKNQKDAMEDSVEIVIEKLLHVTKDITPKVANEAERCLAIVLSQYDAFRCLSVIFPLLVTEDEKTLVTCINCLTKLVGRLSQEELMPQLPSFLPALFEAFGNQSADVRKTVVFCLVDIYIMLGKAFLPYLEGLNSTQLRLVTIYANRISQARSGTALDVNHD
ncbi:CLIP-associated protein [Actinidia rufa]|uniref:CLIP-associated protein n=1 Tax=Actinidia rufa TaxID=165716 RepID=A0A7J0H3F9_9ERIC|nr:CLIP-associated protein [Actinidia rufa]